jgi:hypothetical protein
LPLNLGRKLGSGRRRLHGNLNLVVGRLSAFLDQAYGSDYDNAGGQGSPTKYGHTQPQGTTACSGRGKRLCIRFRQRQCNDLATFRAIGNMAQYLVTFPTAQNTLHVGG